MNFALICKSYNFSNHYCSMFKTKVLSLSLSLSFFLSLSLSRLNSSDLSLSVVLSTLHIQKPPSSCSFFNGGATSGVNPPHLAWSKSESAMSVSVGGFVSVPLFWRPYHSIWVGVDHNHLPHSGFAGFWWLHKRVTPPPSFVVVISLFFTTLLLWRRELWFYMLVASNLSVYFVSLAVLHRRRPCVCSRSYRCVRVVWGRCIRFAGWLVVLLGFSLASLV
jgi:heme O synthase-like polyprenyltransferase